MVSSVTTDLPRQILPRNPEAKEKRHRNIHVYITIPVTFYARGVIGPRFFFI